eukprot:gnl/TRDRNA2_/TRDRNA2_36559_c0_seq2.p1 gnl/TRDRNA2_/TRDRNA2_36559_c0~~gnl/TRDRNA2_/TRDRNA2_36559_c0_seq2.p1  ORF type:complete len:382 (-),score=45.78 gnl/TRDRNA2_/TRDRNA2_36559_c0_seq2:131-1243(-)
MAGSLSWRRATSSLRSVCLSPARIRSASVVAAHGLSALEPQSSSALPSSQPRPATRPEEVMQHPALVLSDEQRRHYFDHGYLTLPGFLSFEWLSRLLVAANGLMERSRELPSGEGWSEQERSRFVLSEEHSRERPRPTRVASPQEIDDTFWEFSTGPAADVAQDLLGPDVRFHHSKLNFKWGINGDTGTPGDEIRWHQDIQFWPHTNYTPLTVGVYLNEVTEDMGPMAVVPLSVHDTLYPLEDDEGRWTGVLGADALRQVPLGAAASTGPCPAGTVTVHNARCVHGSAPNFSKQGRPLLLNTFAAATAQPVMRGTNPLHAKAKRGLLMVRGREANIAVFDPRPCPMAPSFEATGYRPPFFGKSSIRRSER